VIIPTFSERESNARRVAATGAGAFVPIHIDSQGKHVNILELRATVRRVLSDPSYLEQARRMSRTLKNYGGASQAARFIQEFWLPTDVKTKEFVSLR
jgi:UDP:flavonoid glycosyltransferase YjiC (YdhE family)